MIKFNKPQNLNGAELLDELKSAGIKVNDIPTIDGDGHFWLDVKPSDEFATASVVAAHNGTIVAPEPTINEKLASVGLSVDDLKAALGL